MTGERQNKNREYLTKDCVTTFQHIVPFIIIFEIIMIIVQRFNLSAQYTNAYSGWYLGGYISLLCTSLAAMVIIKKQGENYRWVSAVTTTYCIVLLLWGLMMTFLDARQHLESVLIYAAVVSLIPMICMLGTRFVLVLEIAADLAMMGIGILHYENVGAFIVNFIVFSVITLVLAVSYRKTRWSSYERQSELEELSDLRWKYAYTDEPTGLGNRRAFSEKLTELDENRNKAEFTIWIFDINGLKEINDKGGHAAGDELIRSAAECIALGIGSREKVYRIGGDEFAAIDEENLPWDEISARIELECSNWQGQLIDSVSISYGYAASAENPELSVFDIEKKADHNMYDNKNNYYIQKRCRKNNE